MLVGQAKKDFEKWYKERPPHTPIHTPYDVFMGKSLSEKYGVIIYWFDSVGIELNDSIGFYDILQNDADMMQFECEIKTRPQARQKAIDKAVEIYNNR